MHNLIVHHSPTDDQIICKILKDNEVMANLDFLFYL